MRDIHIWLFATQIVGLSIIGMFAVYVLLQFFEFKTKRNKISDLKEKITVLENSMINLTKDIQQLKKINESLFRKLHNLR